MFTSPINNLKAFALHEGSIVADLGAGTGHYTIAVAPIVGRGKVYAIDISKDFVTTIKNKIVEDQLDNVEVLWGNVETLGGTRIKNEALDAAIASNILFQVEDKHTFIDEIKRILKPKGRLLLVDWHTGPGATIPTPKGALSKELAHEIFNKKGFVLEREIDAGAYHYGMILVKE